jgi:hypothetical protein
VLVIKKHELEHTVIELRADKSSIKFEGVKKRDEKQSTEEGFQKAVKIIHSRKVCSGDPVTEKVMEPVTELNSSSVMRYQGNNLIFEVIL